MDNILKRTLDGRHVDKTGISTGPWSRYLIITSTDKGKTLNNLSPFVIDNGVKGIAVGEVTIKCQVHHRFIVRFPMGWTSHS